ncbi:MAG: RecX family transcriptional regulator [Candidatus Gracilibacteria bacterium]|nr:RecX family transcriptional regulator [Candidatus Gracilibacteria bacterium]
MQKLKEKSKDTDLPEKVFENIKHLIDEKQVIQDKIRLYLLANKNYTYIKNKLAEKLFDKDLVKEILDKDFFIEGESLLNENSIRIKVQNYKRKNKSITYIRQKLVDRQEDKEIIDKIIDEVFGEERDFDAIKQEISKLGKKYEKEKIIQKLLVKGFRYDDIKRSF